jgi:tRNA(Ile)-lysidine synthase
MDTDLRTFIHQQLAAYDLATPTTRFVVAVSGGPDSLALLHLLVQWRALGGPQLHVAHLDHGFRGADSAADAAFVAEIATQWQVPHTVATADGPGYAQAHQLGTQAAARALRYAFLAQVALQVQADAVLTAHHADDQAETVLLHLLRGAGLAGLRGMLPYLPWAEWGDPTVSTPAPALVRPLLSVPQSQLSAYCAAAHVQPRIDPSNTAPQYSRSQIRTQVLPLLQTLNPDIVATLGRTATLSAADYAFVQAQLDTCWAQLVRSTPQAHHFDAAQWQALHPALQRHALRRATTALGCRELSYAQIEAARTASLRGVGSRLELAPNLHLITDYHGFRVQRGADMPVRVVPQLTLDTLKIAAGRTPLGNGWSALVQTDPPTLLNRWWIGLPSSAASAVLTLRRRQSGDRIRPVGAPGQRKLQDLFVDLKIPRVERTAWPILTVNTQIAWVAGLRTDARFAIPADQATIWVGLVPDEL